MTVVVVALSAAAAFLAEHSRVVSLQHAQTKAAYLAHAGIMQAVYDFRAGLGVERRAYAVSNPSAAPGPTDDAFVLAGPDADFLLVNTLDPLWDTPSTSVCGAGRRDRFRRWRLWNVLRNNSVVIQQLVVSWTPNSGERVLRVDLGGSRVWEDCTPDATGQPGAGSGEPIVLSPNVTVPARAAWTGVSQNALWFNTRNGVMPAKGPALQVDLVFTLADQSSRAAHYAAGDPSARSAEFTIRSTGEVRQEVFPGGVWRRFQMDYRMSSASSVTQPGALTAFRELSQQTP